MEFIKLSNEIFRAIYSAVVFNYYSKDDLEYINFAEIREWVGLEYIDPEEPNYSTYDRKIDDYIIKICEALKLIFD